MHGSYKFKFVHSAAYPALHSRCEVSPDVSALIHRWAGKDTGKHFPWKTSLPGADPHRFWFIGPPLTVSEMKEDPVLLHAALAALESRLTRVREAIAEMRRALGHPENTAMRPSQRTRRTLSLAARRRHAAARRKRWAENKKARGQS